MNKSLIFVFKVLALLGFTGMLLSIIFDWSTRIELICCTVACLGTFIVFKQKKKRTKI